jgi:uncharacterized protein
MANLTIVNCTACGYTALPPKYMCPKCRNDQLDSSEISGRGQVYSYTTIHVATEQFAGQVPYHLLLVQLENSLRLTARLLEGTPSIGSKVELARHEDEIYWFLPVS